MRLILVRHAEAAPGQPDDLRPLTTTGHLTAIDLGEQLARKQPDAIVSSPLLRSRETASAIGKVAGLEPVIDERLAPGATAEGLLAAIAGLGETVVTIGHQPDCSEIMLVLTGREVEFPTAGFAEVEL